MKLAVSTDEAPFVTSLARRSGAAGVAHCWVRVACRCLAVSCELKKARNAVGLWAACCPHGLYSVADIERRRIPAARRAEGLWEVWNLGPRLWMVLCPVPC